ncbi:MAG: hypothetical protein M3680_12410 [Myxococcota bacterium]|nr:hypothetical protein [Myxococcota bacterium]
MRAHQLVIGALLLGAACTAQTGTNVNDLEGDDEASESGRTSDECKIEGSQIGEEGLVIRLGAKTVTITNWVAKTGSPDEYVGFSIGLAGGSTIGYVVKSSVERHPSTTMTWLHPNGADGGAGSPGVSNVDFCGECEGGACGEDPSCDNPDGCDGGDGGGGGEPTCDNPDGCGDTGGTGPLV